MDRDYGAQDALAFVRRTDFAPSSVAFDAAIQRRRRIRPLARKRPPARLSRPVTLVTGFLSPL